MDKEQIIQKLSAMLNECLESYNQQGTFTITDIDLDKSTGTATFTWCECEGEPCFSGY